MLPNQSNGKITKEDSYRVLTVLTVWPTRRWPFSQFLNVSIHLVLDHIEPSLVTPKLSLQLSFSQVRFGQHVSNWADWVFPVRVPNSDWLPPLSHHLLAMKLNLISSRPPGLVQRRLTLRSTSGQTLQSPGFKPFKTFGSNVWQLGS